MDFTPLLCFMAAVSEFQVLIMPVHKACAGNRVCKFGCVKQVLGVRFARRQGV